MEKEFKNNIEKEILREIENKNILVEFPAFRTKWEVEPKSDISNVKMADFTHLNGALDVMNAIRINIAYREIRSNVKVIGPLIVFFRKVLRKFFLKWYLEPVCFQQTDFNVATTEGVKSIKQILTTEIDNNEKRQIRTEQFEEKTETRIEELETYIKKIEIVNDDVEELKKITEERIESLENLVIELTNRIEVLNDKHEEDYKISGERVSILETMGNDLKRDIATLDFALDDFRKAGIELPTVANPYYSTFSQAGEDSIVRYLLGGLGIKNQDCTYLDLGANHAIELSNTYWLYRQGARGVLVEASRELIPELQLFRKEDIILNRCVGIQSGKNETFFLFREDGLSTISKESMEHCLKMNPELQIKESYEVSTITVTEIIENYMSGNAPVLLNIDLEGIELDILQSIDFDMYRPAIIVVEVIDYNRKLVVGGKNKRIIEYLEEKGYQEYAFTGINAILVDSNRL